MVKKIALSLVVIAASGAYVWSQAGQATPDDLLAPLPVNGAVIGDLKRKPALPVAAKPIPSFRTDPLGKGEQALQPLPKEDSATSETPPKTQVAVIADESPKPASAPAAAGGEVARPFVFATAPAVVPLPRLRPTFLKTSPEARVIPASMTASTSTRGYVDGTYAGPVVDAYYGLIQIEATVQGGRLVSIRVLKYPSDRRTSVYINRQALPMLRDEVVSAQTANVDIISGATLTSEAFIRSLGGALKKARL